MTKLSDTQASILSQASRHEALLAAAPSNLPAAARQAVIRSMLKNLLLEEVPAPAEHGDLAWRLGEGGVPIVVRITADGLRAIGVEPSEPGEFGTEHREVTEAEEVAELALQQEALDSEKAAQQALAAAGREQAPPVRQGLRETAQAAVTAWEAQDGLEAALAALKAALGRQTPVRTPRAPREGTKQEAVLTLLRREEGATIAQVMEATGWAQHTVRGFFAGLKKKGVAIEVLERVKQVSSGKQGAKGSYSIYRVASPAVAG
ncbi:DUF3489 domain-containing protein [Roseococcus sp. SYP-B2431]|uniref:DUF3489 domain-containing protein n=1 Tax=Roseococcus sp. SYP-B2431 TaxID=2496640 RepID=UPI00103B9E52|nr:DUF3489 domain-containing protein [Roseococcus sp. SYP-B2431]TCI00760.1 DUF3489 domain-containing protein [Roseococcus sp. SYP-B2431]